MLGGCQSKTAEQGYLQRGKELVARKEYARALIEFKNAARLQPNNPEIYYQASLAYLAMGDYKTAYQGLVKATEVDPKHAAAHNKLAELIASSINSTRDPEALKEAEQRVQAALAIMPDSADALGALGLTEYLMGKPEDAATHLQSALAKFPKHISSARALAMIRLNQGNAADAERILTRVAEDSKTAEAHDKLGRFYASRNRAADAEAAYRRAVEINPQYGAALQDLYTVLYATGRKEEAEKTLVALSALPDKQYRSLHALYLLENGKPQEGIAELERQAAAAPADRDAFTRLTSGYFFTRRFPDAERVINAALQKNPKDTNALLERGKLYIITARFAEAEADLNQVRKAEPNSAIAHFLLAQVFRSKGQDSLRRDELATALNLAPTMVAARVELAQALSTKESAKSAVELLDQAPQNQKELLPVILQRNWALLVAGDAATLRKGIDRGLVRYPKNPDLILQDGVFQFRQKDFTAARWSLETVLTMQPDKAEALNALAKTYVASKNSQMTLQTVQAYVAKRPQSPQLQNVLGNWMAASGRYEVAIQPDGGGRGERG